MINRLDSNQIMPNYDYTEEEELVTCLEDFEPPVQLDTSLAKFIIVDGIPIANEAKHEKLESVLKKIYGRFGTIVSFTMPLDAKKTTKGYCFVEYSEKDSAVEAINTNNGVYQLDQVHKLKATAFEEHSKYSNLSETYVPPKAEDFAQTNTNYYEWLYSERSLKGFDQFALSYGDNTEICWNEMNLGKPITESLQSKWTQSYVQWSNSGAYMVTIHKEGVKLYGGENWQQAGFFKHQNVQLVDFSPEDKYLITFSSPVSDNPKDSNSIIVWDVRSGKRLRSFPSPPKDQFSWPAYNWSAKDKYFSRQFEDKGINIFVASTCNMLNEKTFPIARLKSYSWSPSDPYLCYFVPCTDTMPGRVCILEVPSMKIVAEKSIWHATDARMHWQNQGDYLCVRIDKVVPKSKKNQPVTTSFELFRMHEPNFPIENFEVPSITKAFAWEPRGKKLCIIHGEHRQDMTVSFFEVQKNKVALLSKLERRKLNSVFWSPRGTYVVLAQVGDTGELEFYNTADLETMSTNEHINCTSVDWNPSGRFVTTTVSFFKVQTDTGFRIWTFAGEPVYSLLKDRFKQFIWRPRPPMILSSKQLKTIRSKLKEYSQQFKELDDRDIKAKMEEENARLDQLMQEFVALLQKGEREYQETAPIRAKMHISEDVDPRDEYQDFEKVEEIVDMTVSKK
ncbi:RNA-binding region RNP-1 domain-containing protein [Heterostelium album PN500]|uniref:Eukaryotic translation initiation factor 3 subunit B n=1 Tax=Heterostelium pallidum (strain ATCC 26659 / Pp 5 / PN500) TaxID=670386 RepID=D3BQG1_HETP5|nr:RNA-binding region RNP-1 domain-containing protein [Heterostelium album PN500]EFA76381.1 RNA-binding region RNP-1 domain-containing protein [Heterostelium album PN500]|eukprot:XP_020428513.1 RNA-binding region RNP-1 domain-containing protein [Heterostelium album PN500]